jgi:hypothetical protein
LHFCRQKHLSSRQLHLLRHFSSRKAYRLMPLMYFVRHQSQQLPGVPSQASDAFLQSTVFQQLPGALLRPQVEFCRHLHFTSQQGHLLYSGFRCLSAGSSLLGAASCISSGLRCISKGQLHFSSRQVHLLKL